MDGVINSIFNIVVLVWQSFGSVYSFVQRETLLRVQRGLPSMERFTERLTGHRAPYLGVHGAVTKKHFKSPLK